MKLNYDIICIFLIIFIFYYLLSIISKKYIIEGNDNTTPSSTPDIMCYGNSSSAVPASKDFDTCTEWPFIYKNHASNIKQCLDGSENCSEETKIRNCCDQRAQMCQGNIDPRFSDWTCVGEDDIPKIDATKLPRKCDENNTEDCFEEGRPGGLVRGLEGCSDNRENCNLSDLPDDTQRQKICCTNYALYTVAETIWGRPHLISAANIKYNDLKKIKETNPEQVDPLLNEALDYLYQARKLSNDERSIIEMINDWKEELQMDIGTGMCRGNINLGEDFPCLELEKEYISDSFIKKGNTSEECCTISGMCSGNTDSNENIECPENTTVDITKKGNTIEECCISNRKCRGNENINLNFNCPKPMIPIVGANNTYGNTKEICCRFPEDLHESEILAISEDETINATIIFNGDILESAGEEESTKRILFERNFKKDLVDILNKEGKVNILTEQIYINKIYDGSIIIDFEIIPHPSGISISKEYFLTLLSEKIYFPSLELYTNSGVSNVNIISWYNIKHWPQWIWYIIIAIITFLLTTIIVL